MSGILLTQYSGAFLGPIAKLLGLLLNLIFEIVPNVGASIIIFTVVIYLFLLPLTYRQQKFSKLSAKMNPELQAIQAKYKNKRDQESMTRQNEEMQAVYKKYGVSPTGSCVQLLIQMPILFALYRVIYSVPAYVNRVYACLEKLASAITETSDGIDVVSGLSITKSAFRNYINDGNFVGENAVKSIIDVLNRASSADWNAISMIDGLDMSVYESVKAQFQGFNNFLGLNIADSPINIMKESLSGGNILMLIGALMVPLLAAATQWLNVLFMPQAAAASNDPNSPANMMKSMNITMPIMSAVFCLSLPCGMGLYWITGAVVRCVQQVVINKHIDKLDMDKFIEKNVEKYNREIETGSAKTASSSSHSIRQNASISTKGIEHSYDGSVKAGGIAQRANLVREYNERSGEK